ncbi:hypothetical protein [Nocardioides aromaticivorans]|uniref:hypothetical protein n=1 Tax=Nocardioides aromaticivorans TaxID=200618 RepID=UPI001A8C6AD5|nr:hypothetical protein [Nocardioides aromaticivorans]
MSPTADRPARARRVALAALLPVVLGALTACGGDDTDRDDRDPTGTGAGPAAPTAPTPTATLDSTRLAVEASVEVDADAVVVTWSVTNRSGAPVLVTNRVPDDSGRLSDGPDQTYVLPGDEPGRVELAKRVLPVAADAVGDAFPWIGVTELDDGRELRETVRVPLPLRAYAPPAPGGDDVRLPEPATSVVFCVGVLSGREPAWGFKDDGGIARVNHGRAAEGQTTRCSEPVALP